MKNVEEVTFWTSIAENLSHPGLVITEVVFLLLLILTIGLLYFRINASYYRDRITQEDFAKYTGISIFVYLIVGLSAMGIGGGFNYSEAKSSVLEENVATKYDLEVVDITSVTYHNIGSFASLKFKDSESGLQRGFYDDETEKTVPSVDVTFDKFGEPTITPWDGVDKNFVDSLIREEWKQSNP